MLHSNVIDIPRPAGSADLLGVDRYVSALVKFITVAQMPTTLAIQGEWGSGKTSLMNQVQHQLCQQPEEASSNKPYYGIWINTWQYSLMKSPEDTLLSVMQGVTSEVLDIIRTKHQSKLNSAISKVGSMFGKIAKAGAKAAVSTAGVDDALVDDLLGSGDDASSGPAAFRKALTDAIAKCLEEDHKAGNNTRGFIFFIDDLDRLDPPVAVQILELLKNLFEVENCIFILAIDYDVVVKGLVPKFGPLTEKNEREFRSFFDKIIQLPFTMPVSSYNIDNYLASSLVNISYYSAEELALPVTNHESNILDTISEMALLSTGTNPRSVKRLINSLSLIQIMYDVTGDGSPLNPQEKLLNFGFVCIQIAYPSIYDMLLVEPDFKSWNEKTAKRFRMAGLDNSVLEAIAETEEFDEEWEQVLYRGCQHNSYLSTRAYSISRLFNLIAAIVGKENFAEEIERLLSFAAVTTVSSNENAKKSRERVKLSSFEDYATQQRQRDIPDSILTVIREVVDELVRRYGATIRTDMTPGGRIGIIVTNNKSSERKLLHIDPRKKFCVIHPGGKPYFTVTNSQVGVPDGLPEDFFTVLAKRFKEISEDKLPAEAL